MSELNRTRQALKEVLESLDELHHSTADHYREKYKDVLGDSRGRPVGHFFRHVSPTVRERVDVFERCDWRWLGYRPNGELLGEYDPAVVRAMESWADSVS